MSRRHYDPDAEHVEVPSLPRSDDFWKQVVAEYAQTPVVKDGRLPSKDGVERIAAYARETYRPEARQKEYIGCVWDKELESTAEWDSLPRTMLRVWARGPSEAAAAVQLHFGDNFGISLWNEDDSRRPRFTGVSAIVNDALAGTARSDEAPMNDSAAELISDRAAKQGRIAESVRLHAMGKMPLLVVGVDAAYVGLDGQTNGPGQGIGIGAAVVIDSATLDVVETTVVRLEVSVDYVPGFLAFREAPVVLAAIDALDHTPELVACDAQGIAHPKRAGLACHVGVELSVPTIGCAKNLLAGSHEPLAAERGSTQPIIDRGDVIGAVLRTQTDVNPVFVSPGHLIDVDSSVRAVIDLARDYRLPETTRAADQLARRETKKLSQGLSE